LVYAVAVAGDSSGADINSPHLQDLNNAVGPILKCIFGKYKKIKKSIRLGEKNLSTS
jgi:hypothetical protein